MNLRPLQRAIEHMNADISDLEIQLSGDSSSLGNAFDLAG